MGGVSHGLGDETLGQCGELEDGQDQSRSGYVYLVAVEVRWMGWASVHGDGA